MCSADKISVGQGHLKKKERIHAIWSGKPKVREFLFTVFLDYFVLFKEKRALPIG
jgi:hypothetical protein